MDQQAGAAGVDGILPASGAPVLFGKLRKSNRRRIHLDPASKVVNAGRIVHRNVYGTDTLAVEMPTRPRLSVTVSFTVYVPVAA